jgi:hypothetical protein
MRYQYQKQVPYPLSRVVSQYWDLEHFPYVHPRTLGEARLVTCHGNTVTYQLLWPRLMGVRLRSVVHQEFLPPNRFMFRVLDGLFRGARVSTVFQEVENGTLVEETYEAPWTIWSGLAVLIRCRLAKHIEKVWEEDLRVGLCHGGWPGVTDDGRRQD